MVKYTVNCTVKYVKTNAEFCLLALTYLIYAHSGKSWGNIHVNFCV